MIQISITEEDRKQDLKFTLNEYTGLMKIMRKKDGNYTDEDLINFELHSKKFMQSWMRLYGRHGITNYIHMIGVGHLLGYMRKYGNLNKYSQQDWEALNALIKLFFFRRTNKGGNNSGGVLSNLKSKLIPIGRLCQRRMLWVCNMVPDDLFKIDYIVPTHTNDVYNDLDMEDIVFDTELIDSISV